VIVLTGTVSRDLDTAVTVITFRGELTMRTKHVFRTTVRKCLAEQPLAVVVDLSEIVDRAATTTIAMLHALHREASEREPAVALLWCAPPGELAEHLSRQWLDVLRVYETRELALAAAGDALPPSHRAHIRLPGTHVAVGLARNLVFDACMSWALPEIAYRARRVVSELATNAVEHAGTDFEVHVVLRDPMIYLAVRDGSSARPVILDPARGCSQQPLDARGRGLSIVGRESVSWGCLEATEGKLVWALLRISCQAAERG